MADGSAGRPALGWYGDDFTGATDTLATLARAGQRTLLFMDVPDAAQLARAGTLDAIGIAGVSRALAPAAMQAELEPVGRFFAAQCVAVLHYKVCSTFDSAAQSGNIATAIATLRRHVDNGFVPIVGGQPNLGRYCVFGNLYARAGADGTVHRIDRHPTMSRHPVTPMHEADLLRHLQTLGLPGGGALHYPDYQQDAAGLDAQLESLLASLREADAGCQPVLLDVGAAPHLASVGGLIARQAARQRLLAVGASSVAQAWLAHHGQLPGDESADTLAPASGPVFVLAGSLSPVTARQIEAARAYQRLPFDPLRWLREPADEQACLDRVLAALSQGRHVLAHTGEGQADPGLTSEVARRTAAFVARVASAMAARGQPLRRLGVAGGDTSSQATRALGLWGLSYQASLGAGVTLCRTHSADPALDGVELMLKGGQVGAIDLFDRLVGR